MTFGAFAAHHFAATLAEHCGSCLFITLVTKRVFRLKDGGKLFLCFHFSHQMEVLGKLHTSFKHQCLAGIVRASKSLLSFLGSKKMLFSVFSDTLLAV